MEKLTFKKEDKIRKKTEYRKLSDNGKRFYYKNLILIYSENELNRSRLGITVSKKVGNAVKRNRIKRIIREQFRKNKNSIRDNIDINVIVKRTTKSNNSSDISKEIIIAILAIGK